MMILLGNSKPMAEAKIVKQLSMNINNYFLSL